MRAALTAGLTVAWTVLACPTAAPGAGLRHLDDGWLATPRETKVLLAVQGGADARGWGWSAGAGSGRLFGMPELEVRALELACRRRDRHGAWSLSGTWRGTGGGLLETRGWTLEAGRTGVWSVGLRLLQETMLLDGRAGPDHGEADLVLGRRQPPWSLDLHLPLDGPAPADARHLRPVFRATLGTGQALAVVSCVRRGGDELLAGAELALGLGQVALFLRFDGASHSLGPGLAVVRGRLMVRTSHLAHPELGLSHRAQVTVFGGPW